MDEPDVDSSGSSPVVDVRLASAKRLKAALWVGGAIVLAALALGVLPLVIGEYARPSLESGEVSLPVVGDLKREGYEILPQGVVVTVGGELTTWVELRARGSNGEEFIPVTTARLGGSDSICTSLPNVGWYGSHDFDTDLAEFGLICEPAMTLSELRMLNEITLEASE